MDPRSAASGQLLTKLQRPGLPSVQHVPRHFSNVLPSQEDCLGCRTFTAVSAQCQHCRGPYCSESCKKQDCQVHVCEFNYTVEASLMDVKHPYISRTLSIPYTLTFEELHQSLQIAFSWRPTTNYEFCMKRVLIASADRIATLAWNKDERARFDTFKNGSTTYVVEAMKDTYADRRILGYCCDASFGLVHCLKIRVASYGSWKHIRCSHGIGHPYAEGFGLDGWHALKDAYQKDQPTFEEKLLIQTYETLCPNGDQYGLRGNRIIEFNIGDVNARLQRVAPGLRIFPDRFRRIWLGPEDDESSLLEQAFAELSIDCMDI